MTIDFKDLPDGLEPSINFSQENDIKNTPTLSNSTDSKTLLKNKEVSLGVLKERLENKSMEKFVSNGKLYFKVGDFYGWLNADNDFTQIGSSCYYTNRKKAHHAIQ